MQQKQFPFIAHSFHVEYHRPIQYCLWCMECTLPLANPLFHPGSSLGLAQFGS